LCNDGLDLSNDQIQAMVPKLAVAAKWPAGLAAKVLAAGVWFVSPAQEAGLPPITAAQCADALLREQEIAAAHQLLARAVGLFAARTEARTRIITPLMNSAARERELIELLSAQIATAENGGRLPSVSSQDVENLVN
jgi:hypothetical protein